TKLFSEFSEAFSTKFFMVEFLIYKFFEITAIRLPKNKSAKNDVSQLNQIQILYKTEQTVK
ncbi:MAG: hypothetical protein LBK82_13120, partial [Planctomycetaceae bacterium]|nr:hypothetical protein [Planctomycetaceae bacterium]